MLHFVVLGALIFGLSRFGQESELQITVTEGRQESMQRRFEKAQGRSPTSAELDRLIQSWVDEEILVREARSLGLDEADPVVRRRLLQKMNWLIESTQAENTDADADDGAVIQQMRTRYDVVIERP